VRVSLAPSRTPRRAKKACSDHQSRTVRPAGLTYDHPRSPRFLRFDVIAGATVWGLLVPESIAYAGLAGLTPQAGLYTLLVTLAAYAVFGTSRHLVAAATSAAAVLFCGGLFLVAGLLRLGFVAQFLSRPV
jgi:SulP family sulfate permease